MVDLLESRAKHSSDPAGLLAETRHNPVAGAQGQIRSAELPQDSAVAAEAKPKAILDLMDLDGLNLLHVKSHLQSLRPLSLVESQTTKTTGDSRSIAKKGQKSKKESRGRRQRQTQDHYLRFMEAQRYLNTTATDQHLGGSAKENAVLYGQPLADLGTFATMPGPSGMVAALPHFDFNQQNLCRPTYDALTGQSNVSIQEVPSGYHPQTFLYPAPEGFSTPNGYPASSNEESLPVLPSSEVEMMIQPGDEDLIEALLNWGDDEPNNLDISFNYDDLRDCLS
ncbi:uncharacterized protein LOC120167777 [Hibiscus syriacus]|uniref:uncharacterized protein LOC120167777 n=1 Tax=Hibiscus syriacus TaxID=106335 RepID=UPI00192296B7|nr:uncharacterized protein LOC120167777 [Hibiscus syriacus]